MYKSIKKVPHLYCLIFGPIPYQNSISIPCSLFKPTVPPWSPWGNTFVHSASSCQEPVWARSTHFIKHCNDHLLPEGGRHLTESCCITGSVFFFLCHWTANYAQTSFCCLIKCLWSCCRIKLHQSFPPPLSPSAFQLSSQRKKGFLTWIKLNVQNYYWNLVF